MLKYPLNTQNSISSTKICNRPVFSVQLHIAHPRVEIDHRWAISPTFWKPCSTFIIKMTVKSLVFMYLLARLMCFYLWYLIKGGSLATLRSLANITYLSLIPLFKYIPKAALIILLLVNQLSWLLPFQFFSNYVLWHC